MHVRVPLVWSWLEWKPGYTWKKKITPQLKKAGIQIASLDRCVYVIRANGIFAISYPKKPSPVLYIGEGNFQQRITSHKWWLGDLINLVRDYSFYIGVAIPRVKKNDEAYKDCEAALILEFHRMHGAAPLLNKQLEMRRNDYEYSQRGIKEALQIGKGVRYHWALTPMRASGLYDTYRKTIVP
ncbi:MAG: hypothetical protein A2X96_04300 [Syntrophobacterales bacterium GWC2_56_13]|nr:MAG: hypothetical protein A2X96_04300 [Syntrophobacterales bacterium GWC2_56_13]